MNTFQATLRNYVGEVSGIVAQRLKRTSTIIDKLKNRQTSLRLGQMQDIGGLRAVVDSVQHVRMLEKKYKQSRAKHILKKHQDYISHPRASGYRGVHLIYANHSPRNLDCDGLFIEIQLRTKLQHLWATAVETAGFIFKEALKSSQGSAIYLEFFQLISALFAYTERQPVGAILCTLTENELVNRIQDFEAQHGILSRLEAIQAVSYVNDRCTLDSAAYWIIKTNLDTSTVEIYPFIEGQQQSASKMYSLLELSGKGQVVLVSVDSVKKLEKAYPSFFLDIREFTNKVRKLLQK
jgi:uncharacterized UPF0146 family protein